ncbi:MAG: hydantoinase B/oxoprolinase family protein, partial [Planctomycetaceae bacterium]|nr:hydantoinase B/oxoprolinase family protein [Planctomycetaceae bacterium]
MSDMEIGNSKAGEWEFWIDVGGTFTDCLARTPEGEILTHKLLSSGLTPGVVAETPSPIQIVDPLRRGDPSDLWRNFACRLFDVEGNPLYAGRVVQFDAASGTLTLDKVLPVDLPKQARYELKGEEEAPVIAIRYLLKLPMSESIPPIQVRLGTTRGTNALLTRRGARTAFITTRGFKDVLLIATQDRPKLFDLAIKKPEPIFAETVEIDERIDAEGNVLCVPDQHRIREQLLALKELGIESLAICLLHAFCNGEHEELVERIAREVGFDEISVSSRLAPLIKLVSRGDTTVVDAYLNPVLRSYVRGIRRSVGDSSLKLMTSAGGLIDAEHFVGKDSILSGPAGGVIGFSRVAERAGFARSIGFDMGGTSTDVARFDGTYEREFETKKAGVRIVAPMLAVETVAAGGGSLCKFDGVKLVVGPESAGANPGPACYGRGGPLTVTDMNLFAGKIPQEDFPFPLDREIVRQKLQGLCDEIADSPLGAKYTPRELAAGFLQIANANMVRAIRNISVAKGYDPRDYTLVTFGGAGGQHACAVARTLGISRVLAHPLSGVLSAYGIGLADIRQFGEQMVLQPYSTEQLQSLETVFAGLEGSAREKILAEGVAAENIEPANRSLDLRYQGVETALNIPLPDDGDYSKAFEAQHRRIYGYVHPNRPLEIVTVRIEVVGTLPRREPACETRVERRPVAKRHSEVDFAGVSELTPIFKRAELHAGDLIEGPAIICEPTSTVVVDPGFQGQVLERGELLLTDLAGEQREEGETAVDPVRLEVFNNLFASIAEQMGTTLQRTSCSTNVKERLDFSCAIFTATGDLVVNAPHIPVHLGAMSVTVKRILQDNPDLAPGDVFVTNDPYRGGSHLPDVTVITPVHSAAGELLFLTASRAHHAEIGGIVPGSMPPFSKRLSEEGVLIRNFKLVDRGRSRETELEQLLTSGPYPTRRPADNLADVSAQVAANHTGVSQLLSLVERYGWPTVRAYMGHIQNAAATKM